MAINVKKGAGKKKEEEVPSPPPAPKETDDLDSLFDFPEEEGSSSSATELDLGLSPEEVRKAVVGEVEGLSEAGVEAIQSLVEKVDQVLEILQKEASQGQQALVGLTDTINLLSERVDKLEKRLATDFQSVAQALTQLQQSLSSLQQQPAPSLSAPTNSPPSADPEAKVLTIMAGLPKGKQFPLGPFVQRMVERFQLDADSVMAALKKGGFVSGNFVKT